MAQHWEHPPTHFAHWITECRTLTQRKPDDHSAGLGSAGRGQSTSISVFVVNGESLETSENRILLHKLETIVVYSKIIRKALGLGCAKFFHGIPTALSELEQTGVRVINHISVNATLFLLKGLLPYPNQTLAWEKILDMIPSNCHGRKRTQ